MQFLCINSLTGQSFWTPAVSDEDAATQLLPDDEDQYTLFMVPINPPELVELPQKLELLEE